MQSENKKTILQNKSNIYKKYNQPKKKKKSVRKIRQISEYIQKYYNIFPQTQGANVDANDA
jgi:hypothetical protein